MRREKFRLPLNGEKNKSKFLTFGGIGLLFAVVLFLSSEWGARRSGPHEILEGLDNAVMLFFIHLRTAYHAQLDPVLIGTTWLGSGDALAIVFAAASVTLIVRREYSKFLYLFLTLGGVSLLIHIFKFFYSRSLRDNVHWSGEILGYSYPVAHPAGLAAALSAGIILYSQRRGRSVDLIILAMAFYILVSVSRIYLGAQYFSDTLIGFVLGSSWAAFLVGLRKHNGWR